MRALRDADVDLRFIGRGGPEMKSVAGGDFQNWIDQSGVLGLWEVIKHYGYFRKQFHETLREVEASKPNAVVLIDYPGFNLRLARTLRNESPSQNIIYYISPQVWAWNRGRIKKMAQWLDLMLCIFPFEAELYNESGLRTIVVGHPMIERLAARKIDAQRDPGLVGLFPGSRAREIRKIFPILIEAELYNESGLRTIFVGHPMIERLRERKIGIQRDPNLVGLFPGSRSREVRKIFPVLVEVARELRRSKPNLRFEVAAASTELANEIKKMLDQQHRHLFEIKVGETAELCSARLWELWRREARHSRLLIFECHSR